MFNKFIGISAIGFVLVSGLVSCSPEKKETVSDVYRPASPQLKHGGETQSLNDWKLQDKHEFDLQDSLDFTGSHANRVGAATICNLNGNELREEFEFKDSKDLSVTNLLPLEILGQDLDTKTVVCSFKFNLFNAQGSNHIFDLPSVTIKSKLPSKVEVAHEPRPSTMAGRLQINLQTIRDVRVRLNMTEAGEVQLVCTDLTLPKLPFERVMDASLFSFHSPTLFAGRPADVAERRVKQFCRVLVESQQLRQSVSDLFEVNLTFGPVEITPKAQAAGGPDGGFFHSTPLANFNAGKALLLQSWQIKNPNPYRRIIVLPRPLPYLSLQLFFISTYSLGNLRGLLAPATWSASLPWLSLSYPKENVLNENDHSTILLLPAEGTLTIEALVTAPQKLSCNLEAAAFTLPGPLQLRELSLDGTSLNQSDLTFGAANVFFGPGTLSEFSPRRPAPTTGTGCFD